MIKTVFPLTSYSKVLIRLSGLCIEVLSVQNVIYEHNFIPERKGNSLQER